MNLTTEGQIEGTPAIMLIDTGATTTLLTRFGTDKRALRRNPIVRAFAGVGGLSRVFRVPINHFQIGPIRSEQMGSLLEIDEMGSRPDFDAIVGSDFLLTMDIEISLAEKKIKYFSPQNCEDTFLGYWNPNAVVVPMEFSGNSRRPMIEVAINGVKMNALIDTGSYVSTIAVSAAARAGVDLSSPGVKQSGRVAGVGQKQIRLHEATFKTFAVGDETIQNAALQISDDLINADFDIILGTDFLRSHRVLFAVSQKNVYLSYNGGPPFNKGAANSWVEKEAETGNGYAQFKLGVAGLNSNDNASRIAGKTWMDKAVANKNLPALHFMALQLGQDGRYVDSVALFEQVFELDSYDITAQLEMFVMRTKAGQLEQAKRGLTQGMAQFKWAPWPAPITDYYLGKIELDDLLREANSESDLANRRRCDVYHHAGALQDALGQAAQVKVLSDKATAECGANLI